MCKLSYVTSGNGTNSPCLNNPCDPNTSTGCPPSIINTINIIDLINNLDLLYAPIPSGSDSYATYSDLINIFNCGTYNIALNDYNNCVTTCNANPLCTVLTTCGSIPIPANYDCVLPTFKITNNQSNLLDAIKTNELKLASQDTFNKYVNGDSAAPEGTIKNLGAIGTDEAIIENVNQIYNASIINIQINEVNNIVDYLKLLEPFAIYDNATAGFASYNYMYNQNSLIDVNGVTNKPSVSYFDENCVLNNGYDPSGNNTACYFVQQYQLANGQLQGQTTPGVPGTCVPIIGGGSTGSTGSISTGCVVAPDITTLSTLSSTSSQSDVINMVNSISTYLKLLEPFAIYDNATEGTAGIMLYNQDPSNQVDGVANKPSMSYFDGNCSTRSQYYPNPNDTACYFVQQYQLANGQLQGQTTPGVPGTCVPIIGGGSTGSTGSISTGCVVAPDITTLSTLSNTSSLDETTSAINNIITYLKLFEPFAIYDDLTSGNTSPSIYNNQPNLSINGVTNKPSMSNFDKNCSSNGKYAYFSNNVACHFVQQYQIANDQLDSSCTQSSLTGCVVSPDISNLNLIKTTPLVNPTPPLGYTSLGVFDNSISYDFRNMNIQDFRNILNNMNVLVFDMHN